MGVFSGFVGLSCGCQCWRQLAIQLRIVDEDVCVCLGCCLSVHDTSLTEDLELRDS